MQDWETDKGEELNEQFYANLRDQYTIVIEEPIKDDKIEALQRSVLWSRDIILVILKKITVGAASRRDSRRGRRSYDCVSLSC